MPNHKFDLWTHATSVAVEDESAAGLKVSRTGYGAAIMQDEGTDNWYHFPIPTGTLLDNETVDLYDAWLLFNINNNAHIDLIHIREATQNGAVKVYDSGPINLTGIRGDDERARHHIDIRPNRRITGPLALCVHATFHDSGGRIDFRGAGARQME